MNRRTLLACALAATFALPAGQASADALDEITERGTIRVAVPQDFPPFGSVGANMEPVGYDIDMANLVGERLGVSVELVPVTSANRIPYLQTNRVDIVISSLGRNPEREAAIDFSEAYAPFYNGIFGPEELDISGPEDLEGVSIGVTRGAVEDLALTELAPETARISRYEDNNGTISAFLSGQVEVVATGNVVAAAILERNPDMRPEVKFLIENSPCYIGLNKGETALQERLNEIIAEAKEDGALDEIAQNWLGEPLPEDL